MLLQDFRTAEKLWQCSQRLYLFFGQSLILQKFFHAKIIFIRDQLAQFLDRLFGHTGVINQCLEEIHLTNTDLKFFQSCCL